MGELNTIKVGEYVTSKKTGKSGRVFATESFTPFAVVVEFDCGLIKCQPSELIRLTEDYDDVARFFRNK